MPACAAQLSGTARELNLTGSNATVPRCAYLPAPRVSSRACTAYVWAACTKIVNSLCTACTAQVRRGDKAAAIQKDVAAAASGRVSAVKRSHTKLRAASADLFLDNRTWEAVGAIARAEPSLPWLVVSDGAATRREAAQRLRESGANLISLPCVPRPDNASKPMANMTVAGKALRPHTPKDLAVTCSAH